MKKMDYEELLNIEASTGADFCEIFEEDTVDKNYKVSDSKLDAISISTTRGIGFRMVKDGDVYYSSTNNLDFDSLKEEAEKLSQNLKGTKKKQLL
ncbi:MAG: hypothetical protein IJ193_03595 [Bacilli bacterium]|nr:hypothetical protein [Bacilli bacterium]